jgi:hypothetical protein
LIFKQKWWERCSKELTFNSIFFWVVGTIEKLAIARKTTKQLITPKNLKPSLGKGSENQVN